MAALIQANQDTNDSEAVADYMLFLLDEKRVKIPKLSITQLLTSKTRAGLSAEILTSSITSRFSEIGIPTGPLEENTPNVMESLIKIIMEELVDAIQNDMRIDVAVDQGIILQASGANSGGPVASVGSSIAPHTGVGVAR